MSEKIKCPQCETDVDVTESHCLKCGAYISTIGSREDLDGLEDLDKTRVGPEEDDEDEDFRTVRVEGFTAMDLGDAGISFDSGGSTPEDVAFQQFMVQEDRTIVGGGSQEAMPQAWTGPMPGPNQQFGPASGTFGQANPYMGSGEFPASGGAFGAAPPPQPPGGFVLVEGADSPSLTVRQEGVVLGRGEEMSTFSGPVDISRGSGTSSPLRGVMWLGFGLVALVITAFFLKEFLPLDKKPIPKKVVYVALDLKTKPSGASVWLNGKKLTEPTPTIVQVRIEERAHLQLRKDGYKTIDFKWTPRGNDSRNFELKSLKPPKPRIDPKLLAMLAKQQMDKAKAKANAGKSSRRVRRRVRRRRGAPPGHAALMVVTDPPGAKVRVSGRLQRGRTPLSVYLQKGLEAKITVQKYGHHDSFFVWKAQGNSKKVIRMYRHSWYNP